MPLYEYECEACCLRFERIRRFSDPPVEICPTCGGHVKKLLSSPAIQFKGSGWYVTDYAKKSSGEGSKGAEGTGDKAEKGDKPEKTDKTSSESSSSSSDTSTSKGTPAAKE